MSVSEIKSSSSLPHSELLIGDWSESRFVCSMFHDDLLFLILEGSGEVVFRFRFFLVLMSNKISAGMLLCFERTALVFLDTMNW